MRISDWSSDVCSSDLWPHCQCDESVRSKRNHCPAIAQYLTQVRPVIECSEEKSQNVLVGVGCDERNCMGSCDEACMPAPQESISELGRSEERRVGKECVRMCRSWWSPYH